MNRQLPFYFSIFISLLFLAAGLSARETYAGLSGYWVDNNTDSGPGIGIRTGWHFPAPEEAKYRISTDVEVEGSYWQIDSAVDYAAGKGKAQTKVLPVLANLRVNVPLADTGLFVYGGGGLGVSWIGIDGSGPLGGNLDDTGAVFTYGFFAGLGGRVTERMEVRVGYRAIWLGDEDFNDGTAAKATLDSERNDMFELALRLSL